MYTLFGSRGSGSAAIEAALDWIGVPWHAVRAATWEPDSELAQLRRVNPLGQVPALVTPDGEVWTESAAILMALDDHHPRAGLLPAALGARAQARRGLVYLAANCYAAIGVIDYPERWLPADAATAALEALRAGARARLHQAWEVFADTHPAQPFLGGERPGALDLLAAVVSHWSGARAHLQAHRPQLHEALLRVEQQPVIREVFARHWPPA